MKSTRSASTPPSRLRGSRLGIVAAALVFLTLVGGGGAVAYWSATATLPGTAKAATIGVTQALASSTGSSSSTPLNFAYSSTALKTAGAVTVTNTGSREAGYTLRLTPSAPVNTGLASAIAVTAFPVANASACTTSSAPGGGSTTGTASSFTATGTIAAGGSLVLCVQTSMTSAGTSTYSEQSGGFSVITALSYAAGSAWTATSSAATFTQSVAKAGPVVVPVSLDEQARYNILNSGLCMAYQDFDGAGAVTRDTCSDWNSQWRIQPAVGGGFTITRAVNGSMPQNPRWQSVTPGSDVIRSKSIAAGDAQRWVIESLPSGLYQIRSASSPANCATVTNFSLWNATAAGTPNRVVLATCDGSAAQSFSFEMKGNPNPPLQTMLCSGNGTNYLSLTMAKNLNYDQEITHRVLLGNASSTIATAVLFPGVTVNPQATPPQAQFQSGTSGLSAYLGNANGGAGNTYVYVQQQVAGGSWSLVAQGKMTVGSDLSLRCGWQ